MFSWVQHKVTVSTEEKTERTDTQTLVRLLLHLLTGYSQALPLTAQHFDWHKILHSRLQRSSLEIKPNQIALHFFFLTLLNLSTLKFTQNMETQCSGNWRRAPRASLVSENVGRRITCAFPVSENKEILHQKHWWLGTLIDFVSDWPVVENETPVVCLVYCREHST